MSAVVDGGMAKPDAMREFGSMSMSPLQRWYKFYREGGAEALRLRSKGRPRVSGGVKPWARTPRAGARGVLPRLETEVAYLNNWIGNTYLDDSGRDSPAFLNSTGDI